MYWYAIYRYLGEPGVLGPYTEENKAWYKLSEAQKGTKVIPWDTYGTYTPYPRSALLEFLEQRQFEYAGGRRVTERK